MCGIFGLASLAGGPLSLPERRRAEASLHTLAHRGPDQWGSWEKDTLYLGHRRLSILDLTDSGRQPMHSPGGSTAVAVNGEIYNYRDLRRELGTGSFLSGSDSEVVLHGYEAWGLEKLLDRLDGMYALAIVDWDRRLLHLARDRAGIKPLYYAGTETRMVWASELKAIVHFLGEADLELDFTALYDFLTYGYVPAPKTAYQGVFKLPPASVLTQRLDASLQSPRRYWHLPLPGPQGQCDEGALLHEVRERMGRSVEEQLVSDVPVGFFLSGGIDSSIVVTEAAKAHPEPRSFSIGFDHTEHDETFFANLLAEEKGVRHKVRILDRSALGGIEERMRSWYDEPFADTSALPTYHVCAFARGEVTVALSGDGGDELFGGYRWYESHARLRSRQRRLRPVLPARFFQRLRRPERLARSLRGRYGRLSLYDPLELYGALLGGLAREEKEPWKARWNIPGDYDDYWFFRQHWKPELGQLRSLQFLDFHTYLPEDILTKVDRVSMAVSLEVRVPFLSRSLMELAFSLPESLTFRGGRLKGGLKDAYRNELPAPILERDKQGFSIPAQSWQSRMHPGTTLPEALLQSWLAGSGARGNFSREDG